MMALLREGVDQQREKKPTRAARSRKRVLRHARNNSPD
jgi:hypothetical protein